ncbi:AraC family transcriptional regulator ligand-binding domain-containing protein [Pseudomonas sp. PD9R]|uniref:AraC family transcriptional regulator ligand-binding domain-containing protein n=1 Tax=Pseudomonas sp. PD9R TaxID=2853534 RepID=UPI001C448EE7|nr:helix-turn-helix domain-containing protein [Pseudomonas sp. PD9R]MBV6821704.1 AraC family transcriptional regulator ligand-binding domain-containing protein [Pseudomonas sp. PD9R]
MTKSDQPPRDQPSANAFYAPTLLPAIEELLARGVAREKIEGLLRRSLFELRTPFMRVPLFLSRSFWAFALEETQDPMIGLTAGRRFVSTATNGLTYLFDVAASLETACDFFERFFPFFSGHFEARIVRHEKGVELRLLDCGGVRASAPIADYILISLCSMLRRKFLASGLEKDPILGVDLAFACPASPENHEQAFRAAVRWGVAQHSIHLDSQLFVIALTPGNHELEQTLVALLEQTRRNSEPTLLEQVSDHLIADLAGANWQQFCAGHHLLERTAARRLKALGWSFSELLDEYRRCRAEDLLQAADLELVEVSDQLGYSDVQSFNRACLRWFGCAPGVYRARWGQTPNDARLSLS